MNLPLFYIQKLGKNLKLLTQDISIVKAGAQFGNLVQSMKANRHVCWEAYVKVYITM